MKKLAILATLLITISLVTAFSFDDAINNFFSDIDLNSWMTGFIVQQYDAKCVDKEITITTNKSTMEYIEVYMNNTGKKWKKHEVGLAMKNYGISIEEGQTETTEIIYTGDIATFSFKATPSYSGVKETDLTIEYQMQRLKGLTTKKQKSRRFGEICYIYMKIIEEPIPIVQEQPVFSIVNQYGCDDDGICDRDSESDLSCITDCAYGDKLYYVKEGYNLVKLPSGYYLKLYRIDDAQYAFVGLNKHHVQPVPIKPGETRVLIERVKVTNLGVVGKYATIRVEPIPKL